MLAKIVSDNREYYSHIFAKFSPGWYALARCARREHDGSERIGIDLVIEIHVVAALESRTALLKPLGKVRVCLCCLCVHDRNEILDGGAVFSDRVELFGDVVAEYSLTFCLVDHTYDVVRGHILVLDALRKAGLMGMSMPRRYGGLNFPSVAFMIAADMVSRADAGFENLWALQDCAETIYEFGSEEQKQHYINRVCNGNTMSMDLTEPDAGSDLQSAQLKATYSEADGCWYLNGVKRFITNGDSDIHLVLARSEEGTKDGRGPSRR